ncbi:MAG: nodulation protein NodN [Cellvibrionales bacterium TMED21]|nr:nodulation protein NodN [Halieaceae bacterium]OUT65976.1 MAG: nodulation protein NodN [Cellvibrionales bacterium TMED21]
MTIQLVEPSEAMAMVGTKLPPGEWVTVDQDRINVFADCTEDRQFIHIDEAAAAQTPFGGTIAHGFLTLSLLTKMSEGSGIALKGIVMGLNYGCDKVRFLNPVRAGKRVRAHSEIMSVDQKDANRFLIKSAVTVEIEGEDTPAVYAEWLSMQIIG